MHQIYLLEGPDGGGKSTLARAIIKETGAAYIHATYRMINQQPRYHTALLELALKLAQHRPVVMDRGWLSEPIYAAAFRGGSKTPYIGQFLDRVALRYGIKVILCLPNNKQQYLEEYARLKTQRVEMYDTMEKVYDLYQNWLVLNANRPNLMLVNRFIDGPVEKIAQQVLKRTRYQMEHDFVSLGTEGSSITDRRFAGNPMAKVVLVGDKSNPKGRRAVWPFFDYGDSSLWLTRSLALMGVHEHELAWLNINDQADNIQWERGELDFYHGSKFIALGNNASRSLDSLCIDHDAIYHPQYYRRFHASNPVIPEVEDLFNSLGLGLTPMDKHLTALGMT